ncbi:MAG TPA: DnaJ domain-containing protein [Blastocatellia bacterium]|nr:DnaJ domain-containing protein [Blastocatellia bacterium]
MNSLDHQRLDKVRTEVARLLGCIREAADHYRVLGVTRDASIDEIREAYRRAVEYLHPLRCRDVIAMDGSMQWKLSQAFLRVVEAFTTLSRPARRIEYDGNLNRRPTAPLPLPAVPEFKPGEQVIRTASEQVYERPSLGSAFGHGERASPKVPDRRRVIRFALRLPVRVTAEDQSWQEVAETWDVSRLGIRIRLQKEIEPGSLIHLELPMPEYLRLHGQNEPIYAIAAIVRYVIAQNGSGRLVGAEFVPDSSSLIAGEVN